MSVGGEACKGGCLVIISYDYRFCQLLLVKFGWTISETTHELSISPRTLKQIPLAA